MLTAIGLMSGTSMDGVDAALVRTDGEKIDYLGPSLTLPYPEPFRDRLRAVLGQSRDHPLAAPIETELTEWHVASVNNLLKENLLSISSIDIIGFHGQTILHRPAERLTVQLGNGPALADRLGVPVAWDFRAADVAAGGQGAPLVPLFHAALATGLELPVAILNIGGVANVTWIGSSTEILAFDTGPGNAPLDDWVSRHSGMPFDRDGTRAQAGKSDESRVQQFINGTFFAKKPPKSIDRNELSTEAVTGLSEADGAATLVEIIVRSISYARQHFPQKARSWVVCGGGRRNKWLFERLKAALAPAAVMNADELGWDGDALEAQAFGFLAVRVLRGLPLSLPTTTGVPFPMPGGRIARPRPA